jgi:predicted DNA-binding transcriptional regulator YafY
MPINKDAYLRYRVLDQCLGDHTRRYGILDLLNLVNDAMRKKDPDSSGIQIRQLRKDIAHMRDPDGGFGAPIDTIKKGNEYYYTYSDNSYSINNQSITEGETKQLLSALDLLTRFEGAPEFEWVGETIASLKDRFDLDETDSKSMGFDSNIDYSGFHHIAPLYHAINQRRVLEVVYQPFDKPKRKLIFHPHYLKQYNNRWFVFGYNATALEEEKHYEKKWNMSLDRIGDISEKPQIKYVETVIKWEEEYFSEIVGVTRLAGKMQEIKLWFNSKLAPYVETKPLHQSQRPAEYNEDGSMIIRIFVVPNVELEQQILGFGEGVEVLSPEYLRKKVADRLKNAVNRYS